MYGLIAQNLESRLRQESSLARQGEIFDVKLSLTQDNNESTLADELTTPMSAIVGNRKPEVRKTGVESRQSKLQSKAGSSKRESAHKT